MSRVRLHLVSRVICTELSISFAQTLDRIYFYPFQMPPSVWARFVPRSQTFLPSACPTTYHMAVSDWLKLKKLVGGHKWHTFNAFSSWGHILRGKIVVWRKRKNLSFSPLSFTHMFLFPGSLSKKLFILPFFFLHLLEKNQNQSSRFCNSCPEELYLTTVSLHIPYLISILLLFLFEG